MKQKHRGYSYLVLVILILAVIAVIYYLPDLKQFSSTTFIREYLVGFGFIGYLVFILLLFLAIVLPIPGTVVVLAGGYLYGIWLGSFLALIGVIIASIFSFWLVRYSGEPLLEKFVDAHHIKHFQHLFKKRGESLALISYLVPIFPSDSVSFLMGLTKISYHRFLALVIIGHIPRLLMVNYIGEDLYLGITWKTAILLAISGILGVIALFREPIKKFLFKELKELEGEAEKGVKEVEIGAEVLEEDMGIKKKKRKNKPKK
ncbi:MAG TPA: TVP38/TMEM64 family protein [Candidatus Nanoarchaeia archaeon]|nr:TVP38/TMEM64 family protein [Candidatus Nanoarchaeia archaeon]